ncbi:MAG: hypothetical protein RL498_494 [Pseudomonadota bacterium]
MLRSKFKSAIKSVYKDEAFRSGRFSKKMELYKTGSASKIKTGCLFSQTLESDIINYEANKKELLDADYKYWHTHIKWTFKK